MSQELTRRGFVAGAAGMAVLGAAAGAAVAQADEAAPEEASAADATVAEAACSGIVRVCISVNDFEKSRSFFTNMLEFKEVACGLLSAEEVAALYGIEGAARYAMLANDWQPTLVQLIEFEGKTGACIRTGRPSWDPGYFDIAMRCDDNKAVRDHMVKLGYSYFCEPHEYTTEWSGSTVSEAVLRGIDDVPVTMIETISEPRPEFDGLFKNITDVAQCVSDIDAADRFYGGVLGLVKGYDEQVDGLVEAILSLPEGTPTRLAMYTVEDTPVVELIQLGIEGTSLADAALPQNAGLFATAFEVADLDGMLAASEAQGFAVHSEPVECFVAPYGAIRCALVDGPDGMLIELFQR